MIGPVFSSIDLTEPQGLTPDLARAIAEEGSDRSSEGAISLVLVPSGELCYISPSVEEQLGLSPEEARGFGYLAAIHHLDLGAISAQVADAAARNRTVGVRLRCVHQKTRLIIPMVGRVSPVHPADQQDPPRPGQHLAMAIHLIECVEDAALPFEDWHSKNVALFATIDPDGTISSINEAMRDFIGGNDPVGMSMYDWLHPDTHEEMTQHILDTLSNPYTAIPDTIEVRLVTPAGERVFEAYARPLESIRGTGIVIDGRDITEQVLMRRRLAESEHTHRDLVEKMPSGLWSIDADGEITYVNPGLSSMLGWQSHEMLGRLMIEFIAPFERDVVMEAWDRDLIEPGRSYELSMLHRTGRIVETSTSITSTSDQSMIAVVHDHTSANRARVRATMAQEALEAANRAKSELVSRISHELRTPLHAISGFADLIARDADNSVEDYVSHLRSAVKHLRVLIDDALDISSLDARRISLLYDVVSVVELANEAVALGTTEAEQRRICIEVDHVDPAARLRTDRTRTIQVLVNLLSNAIKYAPEGSVVTLRSCTVDTTTVFEVTDQGPGVAEEEAERIFFPFTRGSNALSTPGSGLGLSVVAATVSALGGLVRVNDSTFTVVLPTGDVSERVGPDLRTGAAGSFSSALDAASHELDLAEVQALSIEVLQVDDDPHALQLFDVVVRSYPKIRLQQACSVATALEQLRTQKPALIYLDLGLPDGDCFEVIEWLRTEPGYEEIPIVVTTADTSSSTKERCEALGLAGYLTKPFTASEAGMVGLIAGAGLVPRPGSAAS